MNTKSTFEKLSFLTNEHKNIIVKEIREDRFNEERWENYNQVFFELKQLNREDLIENINLKISNKENINQAILDIINEIDDYILSELSEKIDSYIDIDWLNDILN